MPKYDFNKVACISENSSARLLLDIYMLAIVTKLPFCKKHTIALFSNITSLFILFLSWLIRTV